jgi:hypothetical protein
MNLFFFDFSIPHKQQQFPTLANKSEALKIEMTSDMLK